MNPVTILPNDAAKWTDVGMFWATLGTGIVLLATAIFAGLAFRSQNAQVRALNARQSLTDQLLDYQAYATARNFTEDIDFAYTHVDDNKVFTVMLKNGSKWDITDIYVYAAVDEIAWSPAVSYRSYRAANREWVRMDRPTPPEERPHILLPDEGHDWEWQVIRVNSHSRVKIRLRFTDEVGGRWEFHEDGRIHLVREPEW